MHLHHPSLSLNGKKKGKQKFRNAQQARKARELDESWKDLLRRQGIEQAEGKRKKAMSSEVWKPSPTVHRGSDQPNIPSLPFTGGACAMPAPKVYTGTKVKGIATMHKSNAVPVFSDEEAVDISKMRR
jgi:hypothetical protein